MDSEVIEAAAEARPMAMHQICLYQRWHPEAGDIGGHARPFTFSLDPQHRTNFATLKRRRQSVPKEKKVKGKRQRDPLADDYLLFIDTNIWLDLYRLETNEDLDETLATILHARERIICTSQVQMELMKNRQKTIIEMLKAFNAASGPKLPPIVTAGEAGRALKATAEEMERHRKRAAEHINQILIAPGTYDVVYQTVEDIVANPTELIMGRQLDRRNTVRDLARKRWELGYPPRKSSDTSMGDAVNWEWLVDCAARRAGHVIIVSRDGDYGPTYGGVSYLNDWLQQEYHSRLAEVGKDGSIVLETHLASALRRMAITVPDRVADAEVRIIGTSGAPVFSNIGGFDEFNFAS